MALALVLMLQAKSATIPCWTNVETRMAYSSSDQVRDLQQRVKNNSCAFVAMAWSTKAAPQQQSVLLWDPKEHLIFRIHVERGTARWEKWTGATKERILADDPADGLDQASYSDGTGRAGLSAAAVAFIKKHAPRRFDAGL